MPCHAAMDPKPLTVSSDETIEDVLSKMKKQAREYAVVVDDEKVLQGLFSYRILLKNILPVSVSVEGGANLEMKVGAAPGIAKRLRNAEPLPVGEFVQRKISVAHPDAPTWHGIDLLMEHGLPVPVVDPESGKVKGLVTPESVFEELNRLKG